LDADGNEPSASGTAAPPPSPENENLQLPADVIQRMRDTVFSFDSFFVQSVENYNAGTLPPHARAAPCCLLSTTAS
jgi:hypothetical protein